MSISAKLQIILFFCFILSFNPSLAVDHCDEFFIVRNSQTGFVLDVRVSTTVSVQYFNGYASQLWRFECGSRPGSFYIVNNANLTVLDVDVSTISEEISIVVVNTLGYSVYQEWYINSNGFIVNAELGKTLSFNGTISEGMGLVLQPSGDVSTGGSFIFQDNIELSECMKKLMK